MVAPLCRATQPTAVNPEAGTLPIRCGRRQECQHYRDWVAQSGPIEQTSVPWLCDGNRFDRFEPLGGVVGA